MKCLQFIGDRYRQTSTKTTVDYAVIYSLSTDFVLPTLGSLNNFFIIYPIETQFVDIILTLIVIVFFKNECVAFKCRFKFGYFRFTGVYSINVVCKSNQCCLLHTEIKY